MNTLRRALLLLVSLPLFGKRVAAADSPASASQVAGRLLSIHTMVLDPEAKFSVRAVLGELDGIEPLTAPDSAERGRVLQLRSFVENKGERMEDSIRHGEEALRIEAANPFLDLGDKESLHYAIARQNERLGRCQAAIPHYRAALPLMAQNGGSKLAQLGTRQHIAFCLHETKQFGEAREINQAILAEAATLLPPDDPKTFTVRLNLAQNEYELGDTAAVRAGLESLLADAQKAGNADMTDQSLFQLGVLAYEGGRRTEALSFMEQRLSLAQASGDPDRIAAAVEALDILHDKLSGAETP